MLFRSKKQNCVALSTAEAKYIATASCATQLLWMRQTLKDYGITYRHVPLLCDNESAIKVAKNLIDYPRTKHIDIRYHFLRDHVEKVILHMLVQICNLQTFSPSHWMKQGSVNLGVNLVSWSLTTLCEI